MPNWCKQTLHVRDDVRMNVWSNANKCAKHLYVHPSTQPYIRMFVPTTCIHTYMFVPKTYVHPYIHICLCQNIRAYIHVFVRKTYISVCSKNIRAYINICLCPKQMNEMPTRMCVFVGEEKTQRHMYVFWEMGGGEMHSKIFLNIVVHKSSEQEA